MKTKVFGSELESMDLRLRKFREPLEHRGTQRVVDALEGPRKVALVSDNSTTYLVQGDTFYGTDGGLAILSASGR